MINRGKNIKVEFFEAQDFIGIQKAINDRLKDCEEGVYDIRYNHETVMWRDNVLGHSISAMIIYCPPTYKTYKYE